MDYSEIKDETTSTARGILWARISDIGGAFKKKGDDEVVKILKETLDKINKL